MSDCHIMLFLLSFLSQSRIQHSIPTRIRKDRVAYANSGSSIVSYAESKLGCDYVYGATGPNTFDCSGLVQWAHKKAGINVPRVSRDQASSGQAVSYNNLQPGDCVFFGSPVRHAGIYVGNGQYIHAPQTGDVVKYSKLSSRKDFNCARRYW